VVVQEGDKEVRLVPAPQFSIHCTIDFRHPLITDQRFGVEVNARNFVRDIATARTFCFKKEVEMLRARGLGLGGDLSNAIVVDEFHILNPEGLRYPDEFVRHKILDAIGDLSLVGHPIIGSLHATKTGHALNHKLVKRLLTEPGLIEVVAQGDLRETRPAPAAVEIPLSGYELA
jgi:UDP-3-O-[3-hydroxymyristoyl] N-acetylglucosamine deacetylase